MTTSKLPALDASSLASVTGGAARVTSRGGAASAELTTMLGQIGSSVKDLSAKKSDGGGDMSMMMMMMMMGGGGGGSAPAAVAAPAPAPAPVVNISTRFGR